MNLIESSLRNLPPTIDLPKQLTRPGKDEVGFIFVKIMPGPMGDKSEVEEEYKPWEDLTSIRTASIVIWQTNKGSNIIHRSTFRPKSSIKWSSRIYTDLLENAENTKRESPTLPIPTQKYRNYNVSWTSTPLNSEWRSLQTYLWDIKLKLVRSQEWPRDILDPPLWVEGIRSHRQETRADALHKSVFWQRIGR